MFDYDYSNYGESRTITNAEALAVLLRHDSKFFGEDSEGPFEGCFVELFKGNAIEELQEADPYGIAVGYYIDIEGDLFLENES